MCDLLYFSTIFCVVFVYRCENESADWSLQTGLSFMEFRVFSSVDIQQHFHSLKSITTFKNLKNCIQTLEQA